MQLMPVSPDNKIADYIDVFGGYNHNLRIGDSEFYDMENMSSDSYPMIGVRKKRQLAQNVFGSSRLVTSMLYRGTLYAIYRLKTLPSEPDDVNFFLIKNADSRTEFEGVTSWRSDDITSERTIVPMGANLVVFPDNFYLNTKDLLIPKNIDNEKTSNGGATVQPCLIDGTVLTVDYVGDTAPKDLVDGFVWLDTSVSPASLKKYYGTQATWQSYVSAYVKITASNTIGSGFKVGDGIKVGEFTNEELKGLNQTAIIKAVIDNNKSVVITGSLEPMPDKSILKAEYTREEEADTYIPFLCDSSVQEDQFTGKKMIVGDTIFTCTKNTAAENVAVALAISNEFLANETLTLETPGTGGILTNRIPISFTGGNGFSNVKGRDVCIGSVDARNLATIIGTDVNQGNTIHYVFLDKNISLSEATTIYPVEYIHPEGTFRTNLKFDQAVEVKKDEKACPALDNQYLEQAAITFSRKMPRMDFVIENQNRLWGCRYGENNDGEFVNEIYCSKLGDPTNWNVYEGIATDSYAASCGTEGEWTGAFNYRGYPTFFKEHHIHTVYGSYPSSYQIKDMEARGIQKGSSRSLVQVNEVLFYKSIHGICAYSGGLPEDIAGQFGDVAYHNAIGCAFKNKYYVNMLDSNNDPVLMVYDIKKGMWHKESGLDTTQMVATDDSVVFTDPSGIGMLFGTDEPQIPWSIETGLYGLSLFNKKYISRINLRMSLSAESRVFLYIEYDSSGEWEPVGTFYGRNIHPFTLPIRTRRCDHFRLRMTGHGDMKLYGISKTIEQGSDK